jgi:hypothetical protein
MEETNTYRMLANDPLEDNEGDGRITLRYTFGE